MWHQCLLTLVFTLICSHCAFVLNEGRGTHIAESKAVLDPKSLLLLNWRVDYLRERITFRVVVSEASPAFTWLAVGFSDRGEFSNADICMLWTDYKGREHFEDMHADKRGRLSRDERQNCEGYALDAGSRSIMFERPFDTCDEDDYVIEDGTVHVIWAHGTDKLFTSEGMVLPCSPSEHGFIRVRLLTPPAQPDPRGLELRFTNHQLKVPASDTTYWCKVIKLPDYVTEKEHHIVEAASAVTKGNEALVHHMEVFHCDAGRHQEIPLYEGNCFAKERPEITKKCSRVKGAWAMGAKPFTYPKEAGLPLGGPRANKYVMLEVHYNNPDMKSDWVDSSGIVLKVISDRRRYDAAIMELGLEYTDKMAIPGGQRAFSVAGHCIPQCTAVGLPPGGITVFGSQLHTHLRGVAVRTRHSRAGRELPPLNADEHYSTHFQEIRLLHRPVRVLPGDYLETTCVYESMEKTNATIGGHAITDEMCVNYMYYYPATELEVCKSAISNDALHRYFKFERRWDNMSTSEHVSPRENYLSINPWTPLRANTLNYLYTESPLSMQCNKSDGTRFQGDWEGLDIPKIHISYEKPPRKCSKGFFIRF